MGYRTKQYRLYNILQRFGDKKPPTIIFLNQGSRFCKTFLIIMLLWTQWMLHENGQDR